MRSWLSSIGERAGRFLLSPAVSSPSLLPVEESRFRSHPELPCKYFMSGIKNPEVIPTRPLPLEAVTRVTRASRCLNTRRVGNATLSQKTRHISQALTDTCVHWEQKPCVFGLKLAWSSLGEWREKGRMVHLSSRGDGSCLTSVGLGSPSLQALERQLLRVSLAGWLMNLNCRHWAQRWANGRGRPSVLSGLGTPESLRPPDRRPSQPAWSEDIGS